MKATVTPRKMVDVAVNGKKLGLFEVVDEWNGLQRMDSMDGTGHIIVLSGGSSIADSFDFLFNDIFGQPKDKELVIISASGPLSQDIKDAWEGV